jgi:MFS family permease
VQIPSFSELPALISRNRFLIALMLAGTLQPIVTVLVRTGASYRAVELGASVMVIGIITAAYSLLPILLGIKVGRYVDRGHDARVVRITAVTAMVSCIGFVLSTDWYGLALSSVAQGFSSMSMFLAMQVMCARDDTPGAIVRVYGNFAVAGAVGQALGSGILALLGGSNTVADAQPLFIVGIVVTGLLMACAFSIPPLDKAARARHAPSDAPPASISAILSVPGFAVMLAISIASVVSIDLMLVYLPLIGVERQISVDTIGTMLAVRALSSVAARLCFGWLYRTVGPNPLIVASTLASGLCFFVIALPLPIYALFTAVVVSGFALGVAVTTALATTMAMMAPDKRGTATSMRMVANLSMQFTVPLVFGLLAAASGFGAIFGALGGVLLTASVAGYVRKPAER